jgi:hypothetical protein
MVDGPYLGALALVDEDKDAIDNGNPLPVITTTPAPSGLLVTRFDLAVVGTTEILAGVALKKIRVWRLTLQSISATQAYKLQSAGVDLSQVFLGTAGVQIYPLDIEPWYESSVGGNLQVNAFNNTRIVGQIWYTLE